MQFWRYTCGQTDRHGHRNSSLPYRGRSSIAHNYSHCEQKKLTFSTYYTEIFFMFLKSVVPNGGSVAEWLACWTQAQKARFQIAAATLLGNSLRQTVHTHCASVHQAAKLVAALLRVAGVTAGLAESNGSLPPGL